MNIRDIKRSLYSPWLILLLVLTGCGAMGFSPQQIAVNQAAESAPPDAVVDTASIQVIQTVEMNGKSFVMVSFNQTVKNRKDDCLFVYGFYKSSIGTWSAESGGGGCSGQVGGGELPPPEPISNIGLNMASGGGSPTDPGVSSIYGLINLDEIVMVRVTWADNTAQEVNVVNNSFLVVRAGQVNMINIEGLKEDGEVVYNHQNPTDAPGKQ